MFSSKVSLASPPPTFRILTNSNSRVDKTWSMSWRLSWLQAIGRRRLHIHRVSPDSSFLILHTHLFYFFLHFSDKTTQERFLFFSPFSPDGVFVIIIHGSNFLMYLDYGATSRGKVWGVHVRYMMGETVFLPSHLSLSFPIRFLYSTLQIEQVNAVSLRLLKPRKSERLCSEPCFPCLASSR